MRKLFALLIVVSLLHLPALAVSDAEIQQAREFVKTPEGQELLKSPEAQKALGEIKAGAGTSGPAAPQASVAAAALEEASVIESAFGKPVKQFGYEIFKSTLTSFAPAGDVPIGPDYMVGPGDSFNITLWGVAEGIFKVQVDREGNIILPKVGVVHVAGLSYGDLKPVIEQELSKYYEKINVGISMAELRSIRVFIVGEVAKPGSYSISSLSTLFNALFSAGGPTKKGTLRNIELIRNGATIAKVDMYKFILAGDKKQDISLQSGDTIFVPMIGPTVGIIGNVYRPAIYEFKGSADLADVIDLAGGLLPTSYLNRVQIERVVSHEKKMVLDKQLPSNYSKGKLGIAVKSMDFVNIFGIYSAIGNLIQLEGAVKYPGPYELKQGARLKDIVSSPAVLTFSAYLPKAEIVRIDKDTLKTKIMEADLQKLFAGDAGQNIELEPGDRVVISSELKDQRKIDLLGEVRLPGSYTIQEGERLSSVLERADGYTPNAYLFGAVFTRKSAKTVQEKGTSRMIADLEDQIAQQDIGLTGLSPDALAAKKGEMDKKRELLSRVKAQAAEGRVVIVLDDTEKMKGTPSDIELENGDVLTVPPIPKIVNVVGQVYSPSSLIYEQDKKVSDYVNRLGGFTKNADKDSTYVLKADGSVISRERGFNVMGSRLSPGDTIIVPQTTEIFNFYANVVEFTKWFYNAAVAYAVISTALK